MDLFLKQQHCLRNHWFKRLTQKYIHEMRAFEIRNTGNPGLGVPISYFALSHFAGVARTKQEAKKLSRFRIQKAQRQTLTKETKK